MVEHRADRNTPGGLLAGVRSDPEKPTIEVPRTLTTQLKDNERKLLAAWSDTQQSDSRADCVPQLIERQAAHQPDAIALSADNRVLTYHEVNCRANQVAHHLRSLGVGPGVLVGSCFERSIDMVVGLLGILKAGGAFVPLDPAYPLLRVAFMLEDTQAPVLITQQSQVARLPAHTAQVVCLDGDAALLAQHSTTNPTPAATVTDLAYVIYTSGSTGQPKGVQITHGSLLNLIVWHQRAFSVSAADRATQFAGPAFDATVWELWPYLTIGASVYLPDEDTRVASARLRDWLVAQQITIAFLPTAQAESVMALDWPRETALRYLLTGADTLHRFPSPDLPFTLVNNYGPTENTVVATSGPVPPTSQPGALPSIGRPIENVQVYILDEELHQVPVGEAGELYIGGAGLSIGYLHRPDLTAERFIPNPLSGVPDERLYRTGDLARFLPDGQIAFLGRADTQIKIRGYRIEPDEVVSVLNSHPAVEASVVTARGETSSEKSLVAYVVPTVDTHPTATALQEHLRTRLPDYMVPAVFVRLESLPLTPNGKVDRRTLPTPNAGNTLHDTLGAETETRNLIEERVSEIIAMLLHLEGVGLDDDFFMLGGHSLLGTQLITRLADTFGVEIQLRTLFDGPTVRELSTEVDRLIVAQLDSMSDEEVQRQLV